MTKNKFKVFTILLLTMCLTLFSGCTNLGVSIPSGVQDVNVQDQHSDSINFVMRRNIRDLEIATTATLDTYTLEVVDATGISLDNIIRIQEGDKAFQTTISAINGNTITTNYLINYAYTSAADISEASMNMAVDGSVTPVIFSLEPTQNSSWDITRMIFSMTHEVQGDNSDFGGISELPRGIYLRKKTNEHYHSLLQARTTGDLGGQMFDISQTEEADKKGFWGTAGRFTWAGQSKHGVTQRLDPSLNESIQLVVQDDLTGLETFNIFLQGHIVED